MVREVIPSHLKKMISSVLPVANEGRRLARDIRWPTIGSRMDRSRKPPAK